MSKRLLKGLFIAVVCISMSSCFSHTYNVGDGAQKGITVKEKNHYLIIGLAPLGQSDPQAMANGATDYTVNTQHTFVDGLLRVLTWGIYTPTTTTVTK